MKNLFLVTLLLSTTLAHAVKPAPEINPLIGRSAGAKRLADPLFEGIVKLSNCSGSLVTFKGMPKSKKALVMTNGHCIGFTKMGEVLVNKPVTRTLGVFDDQMKVHKIQATRIVYATQTHTDVTFYEVDLSYADIEEKFGIEAFTIEDRQTVVGTQIDVVSGYWEIFTSCTAEAIVPLLKEDIWTWKESVRYSAECKTKGGYSGSPVIARNTRTVVAIHNTGHNGKFDCSDSNPCEQNTAGEIIFNIPGRRYAQQVYQTYSCLDDDYNINLEIKGCRLPKP